MPFVLGKEHNTLCVEFGNGASITFVMGDDAGSIQALRSMIQKEKRAARAAARIETLTARAETAKTDEEYQRVSKEIEQMANEPDGVAVVVDLIATGAKGWTDYFADKDAAARNEPVPFTKENIEKLPILALKKISKSFTDYFGITEDEAPGEAQGRLQEPSTQASKDLGSSQTGIKTSELIAT